MANERDRLRIEYIPLSKALEWDWEENPKAHDMGGLADSIWRYGFLDPPKYDAALDRFVYGNGRTQAVAWGQKQGREPPAAVDVDKETGEWLIPVKFGCDSESAAVAKAFAVDHNNLTYAGAPGVNPWDLMRMWDEEGYLLLVQGLAVEDVLPVSVDGDDLDALSMMLRDDWLPDDLDIPDIEGAGGEALRVIIQFANEEEMAEFFEFVGAEPEKNKVRYNWADIRKGEE